MVDRVDQHETPEHVGQENELCRISVHFCPVRVRKSIAYSPFLEGEIGLADIIVQRLHELLQQEFRPRVRRVSQSWWTTAAVSSVSLNWGIFSCPAEVRNCLAKPTPRFRAR